MGAGGLTPLLPLTLTTGAGPDAQDLVVNGHTVDVVSEFVYLGSKQSSPCTQPQTSRFVVYEVHFIYILLRDQT